MEQVNWEPILWTAGILVTVFLAAITGLLTWIARLLEADKKVMTLELGELKIRQSKSDKKFRKQQKQIYEIRVDMREQVNIIKNKLKIP